jgi:hypothetical protein
VRFRWAVYLAAAMLALVVGGVLPAPLPVGAVDREIVALQQQVEQLIRGQRGVQTAISQDGAVEKTLTELSLDSVNKFNGAMGELQPSLRGMLANSEARLNTMSMQVQGISEGLQETLAIMRNFNQQLAETQNALQGIDAKLADAPPASKRAPRSVPRKPPKLRTDH